MRSPILTGTRSGSSEKSELSAVKGHVGHVSPKSVEYLNPSKEPSFVQATFSQADLVSFGIKYHHIFR